MKDIFKGLPKELGKKQIKEIKADFEPLFNQIKEHEKEYEFIISQTESEENILIAENLRKKIKKIRTTADKAREEHKKMFNLCGKAIQTVYNELRDIASEREEKLKYFENYFVRIEEEKRERIRAERTAEMLKIIPGDRFHPGWDFAEMDQEFFEFTLDKMKKEIEAEKVEAEIEAQKSAEQAAKENKFLKRKEALAPYYNYGAYEKISIDSTEEEFENIFNEMIQAKKTDEANKAEEAKKQAEKLAELEKLKKQAPVIDSNSEDKEKMEALLKHIENVKNSIENKKYISVLEQAYCIINQGI